MEPMYRQIVTTTRDSIEVPVPDEWKGMDIEIIAFPVSAEEAPKEEKSLKEKREEIDKIFDQYLIDLSGFHFNRDEANDYD
jgi:hypothetical protein